MVQKLLNIG